MRLIDSLYPEEESIYLISIDPGSSNIGFAVLKIDLQKKIILESNAQTFDLNKIVKPNSWIARIYDHRTAKIFYIRDLLISILETYNPSFVACETPYFNPTRPSAFGSLVETLTTIKQTTIIHCKNLKIDFISPSVIKMAVNSSYKAKKEEMLENVSKIKELNFKRDFKELDEHSIDALAIGYASFKNIINGANCETK